MFTKEAVLSKLEDFDFLRLQFVDILGRIKNVEVPRSQFQKAVNGEIMFDGSSIEGFVRIEESDMFLKPDIETFAKTEHRVARLICDVFSPGKEDQRPFLGCPRNILKKQNEIAANLGFKMQVGPEAEFFLLSKKDGEIFPMDQGGYFDAVPFDSAELLRRGIVDQLEEMGFEIEAMHHEVAPGQQEIDFKYGDPVKVADNVTTFKFVIKKLARAEGYLATFMPKPLYKQNGSGMHCHQSLFNDKGKNVFYDSSSEDGLSNIARWYIGGTIKHAKALTFITNPTVNSYKRLVPGYEAPVNICWSHTNRSPMIRIPARREIGTRMELRSPDPACNPYLAFAAMLAAGLDGIKNEIEPGDPIKVNLFEMVGEEKDKIPVLPANLGEAIKAFKQDEVIQEAIGEHISQKLIASKTNEWDKYNVHVYPWEHEKYLSY